MRPLCQCGCGEYLPEGSTRKYKRGHSPGFKANGPRVLPATQTRMQTFNPFAGESADTLPNENSDASWWEINPDSTFTLNDAANSVANDPDPWAETPISNQPLEIKITASVRRDMEAKLAFMMGMSANMWQMADPICGGVMAQSTPGIAKALVPIMCQSQDVVRWFQKASNFSLYINLAMSLMPLLSTVYAHHLSKTKNQMPNPTLNGHSGNPVPESAYGVS